MSNEIIQPRVYVRVFIALIVLTLLTVGTSRLALGLVHTWLGLTFAVAKALLVVLFFMHVYYRPRFTWLAAGCGAFFLAIFVGYTLTDYMTRPQ